MFPGAGEVLKGEGELGVGDGAEIAGDAVFQADRGFGIPAGDDGFHLGEGGEVPADEGAFTGGGEEIEIADGFPGAAVGAGDGDAGNFRMEAEGFEDAGGEGCEIGEEEAVGEFLMGGDFREDFRLGFRAEARKGRDEVFLAGVFEGFDGVDAESVVKGFDFFGAEALDFKEGEDGFRKFLAKIFVEGEATGFREFAELVAEGIADAFDSLEGIGAGELHDVFLHGCDDFGALPVGADFEWIFALQLEQEGDFLQGSGHFFPSDHARTLVVAAGRRKGGSSAEGADAGQVFCGGGAGCGCETGFWNGEGRDEPWVGAEEIGDDGDFTIAGGAAAADADGGDGDG